ncbi:MAG: serine/threonine protein kinase [Myxococcales bacterium]|nr:serine/threonine protein kinase [Myxococcales bacterium]
MTHAVGAEQQGDDPARPGDLIAGRYLVEGHLGRGASGVVYSARDKRDQSRVALKIIHPELCHSRQVFGRYKREASILKLLKGERIVKFLDFVEHEGLLAIALEFVPGSSLEAALAGAAGLAKVKAPLEPALAVELVTQICEGLGVAHEVGIVHRDLKPANIMITEEPGRGLQVRILDFGLAKVVHGEHMVTGLTERDMIFGTPEYMAPEQARGDDVDPRCDIYSCGVMLYEMVTGHVPIKGATPLATMTAQLVEPIEPPRVRAPDRGISAALEAVILRALDKDPAHRYRSAKELVAALEAVGERRVISMTPQPDDDLHAHDTELSLRRSQIQAAGGLLEEAERIARARGQSQPAPKLDGAPAPAPAPARALAVPGKSWLWPVVSVLAILICVALGVLLALE